MRKSSFFAVILYACLRKVKHDVEVDMRNLASILCLTQPLNTSMSYSTPSPITMFFLSTNIDGFVQIVMGGRGQSNTRYESRTLTSSSPLAAKAGQNLANLCEVHSACHIYNEWTPIDIHVSHGDGDVMSCPHFRLIRHSERPVIIVYNMS